MKSKPNLNKSVIAAAVSVLVAAPAFAQQAPEAIQRVEITGSSIKQTAREAAGSVQVLNRADIERTGAMTALGVLTQTASVGVGSDTATASSGSFATGSSSVDMRYLGKVSTLVLVNGRRIAPYGLSDNAQEMFTNLDAIAAESIERIEILKDGASAIYGSDAIAGVVNIILKKDYTGIKLKGAYTAMPGFKDYRNRNVGVTAGFGDLETDGFNTYVALEAYKQDGWTQGELKSHVPAWHARTPGRSTWDAKSAYSPSGNYFINNKLVAAPGCPADALDPADGVCKFDVLPYTGSSTDNERWALTSNTRFRIGSGINANFEITAAGAKTDYRVAPQATFATSSSSVWYNAIEGKMVGPFSYPKLPVGHPMNPYSTPVELRARLMDTANGFNFNKTDSDQSRFMLSLDGTLGDYDWKSAVGYMTSTATKATRATSAKGYTDAIVNGTYQFGKQNDVALLETMFPVRTTKGGYKIAFADATVTGTLMDLPAGPLNFAVGGDLRRIDYHMESSDNVLRGELVGIFGLQVDDAVTQGALFAEANIPVLKRVELNAAVRADKTSNSDVHFSPKLGLKINATDSLLLRATAAGGFRAPNIVETGNGLGRSSVSNSVNDLKRCPTATELNNIIQKSNATPAEKQMANTYRNNDCLSSLPSFVRANPDLKPETSKSFTIGAVWEPIKNTWLSLDFFRIERKDEIGTRTVVDLLKAEDALPAGTLTRIDNTAQDNEFIALAKKYGATSINAFPAGKLGLVYNPYVNSGKTRVKGFDFSASTRQKLGAIGDLSVKLDGVYNWNYQTFNVGDGAYGPNQFGTWDSELGRWKANLNASLRTGAFDNGIIIRFASPYSNNSESSPTYCATQKVDAENLSACERVKPPVTVDYNFAYTGFKSVKLALYVNNLFDKEQPVRWRSGYNFARPAERTVGVSATYQYK